MQTAEKVRRRFKGPAPRGPGLRLRKGSQQDRAIQVADQIVEILGASQLSIDQAERVSNAAYRAASFANSPIRAERIGMLIDFADVNLHQAKLLGSRLIRSAIRRQAAAVQMPVTEVEP